MQVSSTRGGARGMKLFPLGWFMYAYFFGEPTVSKLASALAVACIGLAIWLGNKFNETVQAGDSIVRLHRPESSLTPPT